MSYKLNRKSKPIKPNRTTVKTDLFKLQQKLVQAGGKDFKNPDLLNTEMSKEFLKLLIKEGTFFNGLKVRKITILGSDSHHNTFNLAISNPNRYSFCSGFALNDDGYWVAHNWILNHRLLEIIETTGKPKKLYYGICLAQVPKPGELQ